MATFESRYGARRVALSEESLADARALAARKFATREWLHRVP
jgi:lipoate-protein ligase A